MTGLNENGQIEGATVYHAGTKKKMASFIQMAAEC